MPFHADFKRNNAHEYCSASAYVLKYFQFTLGANSIKHLDMIRMHFKGHLIINLFTFAKTKTVKSD